PNIDSRPPLRRYVDLRSFVNNNEFTIWETQSNVASLFATLVGSGLTIPNSWTPGKTDHKNPLVLDKNVRPVSISSFSKSATTAPAPQQTSIEMITVPASSFIMGRTDKESNNADELPRHTVSLSTYDIGKFEVTNNQYIEFLN